MSDVAVAGMSHPKFFTKKINFFSLDFREMEEKIVDFLFHFTKIE